jgi:uncharacterized protein
MQKVILNSVLAATFGVIFAGPVLADTDPTVHEIYEAAESGQLQRAQEMMDQVLKDHPNSSKAHYVQSELYAREGKINLARAQFDRAEELSPGLPKENPRSVAELKAELGLAPRTGATMGAVRQSAPAFPWGTILVVFALVLGVIWMLFRRRPASPQYPAAGMPGAGPVAYPPAGYGPGTGPGMGSTIAGGLAGGLAAGAGIVAGEEIARNLLEGGHRNPAPLVDDDGSNNGTNSDMGGSDFGVDDPGSWDDGSSGGGGGGDDWT